MSKAGRIPYCAENVKLLRKGKDMSRNCHSTYPLQAKDIRPTRTENQYIINGIQIKIR